MADKVKLWLDVEADFLEVSFRDEAGYMKETANDAVMKRVDQDGNLLGFTVTGISRFTKSAPMEADLTSL